VLLCWCREGPCDDVGCSPVGPPLSRTTAWPILRPPPSGVDGVGVDLMGTGHDEVLGPQGASDITRPPRTPRTTPRACAPARERPAGSRRRSSTGGRRTALASSILDGLAQPDDVDLHALAAPAASHRGRSTSAHPPFPRTPICSCRRRVGVASAPKRFTFEYQVKSIDMAVWGYSATAVLRDTDVKRIDYSTGWIARVGG
jgi:hypothetical protein